MTHRRKTLQNLPQHALCRRVRGAQGGESLLQGLEFPKESIVVCIGYERRIQHVILVGMQMEL
jgi:hypothetical protein